MAGRQCPSVRSYTLASYHKLDAYLTLPSTYFVIALFLKGNFHLLRLRNLLYGMMSSDIIEVKEVTQEFPNGANWCLATLAHIGQWLGDITTCVKS